MPVREEVLNWIEEAKADLRHAKSSIEIGDFNWACFASQQAAEKALKALILHVLGEYPRGHDLVRLYWMIEKHIKLSISKVDLMRLSAYYTQARYPNAGVERPSIEILEEHAKEAVETAERVVNEVEKAIEDP